MVLELALIVLIALLIVIWVLSWYRIVPPTEAHVVITPTERFVVSPEESISTNGRKTYFAIPSWLPFIGRTIKVIDMTIKQLDLQQETYEKGQARYRVGISVKYRIQDVLGAANKFDDFNQVPKMLQGIIESGVRVVTGRYDVIEARGNKKKMSDEILLEIKEDLKGFGIELVNVQLVDFSDIDSNIQSDRVIENISKRREVEIESQTRQENAERIKNARMKEAEAAEAAGKREIERDKVIGEQEQLKIQFIAEKEKISKNAQFDVTQVAILRQAQITKDQAIIKAEQDKATELIYKERKRLQGEGDRLMQEEQAKGTAAPIRESGYAEADVITKKQIALSKYDENAVRALVAEKLVEAQVAVGVANAKALEQADVRVFVGGDGDSSSKDAFNLAKAISATGTASVPAAKAMLNRLGIPSDLGFTKKDFGEGDSTLIPKKQAEGVKK